MKIEVIDITPALAAELLKANSKNRNMNAKTVATYARDMSSGNWLANGEAIKVSDEGIVLDGQHRLQACVASGITLYRTILVTGLDPETQDTMDAGRKRTTADSFKISGLGNVNILASVARRVWMWDRGNYKFASTESPTTSELKEVLVKYPSLVRSAEVGARTNHSFNAANATAAGVAHHLFAHLDEGTAAEFFAQVATGARLDEGDPILTLRNRLMREKARPYPLTATLSLAFFIRSWNAVREGRQLAVVVQSPTDPMPMPV